MSVSRLSTTTIAMNVGFDDQYGHDSQDGHDDHDSFCSRLRDKAHLKDLHGCKSLTDN